MYNNNSTGNNQDQPTRGDKKSYTCECGTTLLKSGKAKHERSKEHVAYENKQKDDNTDLGKEECAICYNNDKFLTNCIQAYLVTHIRLNLFIIQSW